MKKQFLKLFCYLLAGAVFFAFTPAKTYGQATGVYVKAQSSNKVTCLLNNTTLENTGNLFIKEGIAPGEYLLRVSETVIINGVAKENVIYCDYINLPDSKILLLYIDEKGVLHLAGMRKFDMV